MPSASITLHPDFRVAPVSRRLFGTFVEHLGRCVYTGIYEPGHPTADADGFRGDVLDLVREMGISTVRYPGGNFVSGYKWEDGIGPRSERPQRLDLAWHTLEPNEVGVDEFMRWARAAGAEPMMAVNLGTRGVAEARDLLEYCNSTADSTLARMRAENGSPEPHAIRMWCLGNEMDGPWQEGHKTPEEYGRIATETARAMRMMEPDLELVVCGSSASDMPLFGEWERVVVSEAFDHVDYVSIHRYYEEQAGDLASFLASTADMDHFIDSVVATVDHVAAVKKSDKRLMLSFDEWNVWYQSSWKEHAPSDWPVAPRLLEDEYTAADAVVVGSMLICLLRHADRVTAASQAQLVNVIAPIMTEPGGEAWRQTTFHPFALTSRYARGDVLRLAITSDTTDTAAHGEVPLLDATATWDEESRELAVFAVNRGIDSPLELALDLTALGAGALVEAVVLHDPDPHARNTRTDAHRVVPAELDGVEIVDGRLTASLPAVSWSVIRLTF